MEIDDAKQTAGLLDSEFQPMCKTGKYEDNWITTDVSFDNLLHDIDFDCDQEMNTLQPNIVRKTTNLQFISFRTICVLTNYAENQCTVSRFIHLEAMPNPID